MLKISALLVTLTAALAYVNHRFVRLPSAVGLMALSLAASLALLVVGAFGHSPVHAYVEGLLRAVDFSEVLLQGMLAVLLFAGALHVDLDDLMSRRWSIAVLSLVATALSTLIVGAGTWGIARLLSLPLSFVECLLFGALISPTDPIAVLGILKSAGAPRDLEIQITGESLFNDGVGVVLFAVLGHIASGSRAVQAGDVLALFAREAVGGIVFGWAAGYVAFRLLKSIDNYKVEVLITLALVLGGYQLATVLHVSGPLAMVVAGLLIGNSGRAFAMSDETREHLDTFWELLDEILNAVLFVLIGLEVLVLQFDGRSLGAALLLVPLVLVARFLSVAIPLAPARRWAGYAPRTVEILTWAGLRGGISVALALSLPPGPARNVILVATYVVVAFSILVQGLTVGRVVTALLQPQPEDTAAPVVPAARPRKRKRRH